MLSQFQLATLYDCATTSKRLPCDFADDQNDLNTIIKYGEIFKVCHSNNSLDYLWRQEDLENNEKLQLKECIQKKLIDTNKNQKPVEWNVGIVVGNSHVAKSLRPLIKIQTPGLDGEEFEFDLDSFAQFRQSLAQAVLAVNPQG